MNWQEAGAYRWLNWLYAAGGRQRYFVEGMTRSGLK